MRILEHTENYTVELTTEDMHRAIAAVLSLPANFSIDDIEVLHERQHFTVTLFLTYYKQGPVTEVPSCNL